VTGPKLNETPVLRTRPGGQSRPVEAGGSSSRSVARYVRVSAYKVREVLDLIRGQDAERAQEILRFCDRDAAAVVGKVLGSAMAGAEHNENVPAEELFVSACFADEGPTLKRWRPRARGRATRIRKRTCHVTVIVSRLPESELRKRRAARAPTAGDRRRRRSGGADTGTRGPSPERERRVRASRRDRSGPAAEETAAPPATEDEPVDAGPATDATTTDETTTDETTTETKPTEGAE
jgi:large subunit ribosomal protein L22